jgi:hypothetical protein
MKTSTYDTESWPTADTSGKVRVRDRVPGVYKEVKTVVCGVPVQIRVRRDNRLDISLNRGKPRFFSQPEAIDLLNGLKTLVNDTFNAVY